MNIVLFDTWNGKFSTPIREHWEKLGHKVIVNPPYDAMLEADLTFCYQADNCAIEAALKPRKGKLIIQCVDIEVWAGQANAIDWTKVDGCLFMADHIKDLVKIPLQKESFKFGLIKPGIDVNKFTFKKSIVEGKKMDSREIPSEPMVSNPVRKIAYVVGDRRIWDVKRLDIAFQVLKDLITSGQNIWQLHIRGTYSSHEQYNAYCRYLEKDLKLDGHVFWYEDRVEDMNAWLEDKDYILVPSTKEAFSYTTAEAMAKGIKPILNNWEGSKDTWGKYVCETQGQMLFEFLKGDYCPDCYRKYIVDNYNQDRYFDELDKFLGLEVSNVS